MTNDFELEAAELRYHNDESPPEDESQTKPDLDWFHLKNKKGEITGVFDIHIRDYIKARNPMFMIGKLPYIYEHGYYKPDYTGAKLKSLIMDLIYPAYIKSTTVRRVYDLFVSDYELQTTYDQLNNYSDRLIDFRNGMFDVVRWKMLKHSPKYRSINQIPFDFDPEREPDSNEVDTFLETSIPDPDDREMLLEHTGLCFTKDTSQQVFLILVGVGGSGKSTIIRLIIHVIGKENVSSVSLKGLSERFATSDLVGKLLNSCADLEEGALDDPTTLKKLLGEDQMRGERKGQDAFDFISYAKLIFSSNDIPVIKGERSDGFYRRLLICPMNVKPDEVDSELSRKLEKSADRFIYLCMEALQRLYKRGHILRSDHSTKLCEQLRSDSDSVQAFLDEMTEKASERKIDRGFLYDKYLMYCNSYERKELTRNRFYTSMRAKGYHESRDAGARYFDGIRLKSVTLVDIKVDDPYKDY